MHLILVHVLYVCMGIILKIINVRKYLIFVKDITYRQVNVLDVSMVFDLTMENVSMIIVMRQLMVNV